MGTESTKAYGFAWGTLLSFKDVKILGLENRRKATFAEIQERQKKYLLRHDFFNFWLVLLNQPAGALGFAAVLFIVLGQIRDGEATLGMLAAYSALIYLVLNPVLLIVQSVGGFENGLVGAKLLKSFRKTAKEASGKKPWPKIEQAIVFNGVTFAYDPRRPILQDLTLAVPKGWHVGIVGQTGCGKSTLLSLLLKIHQGYQGEIRIDHTEIGAIRNDQLRDHVSYLGQDSLCFLGHVLNNVDPRGKLKNHEVEELLRKVQFGPVLDRLKGGLYAPVEDNTLSGGERQRLFLARSAAKGGDLLVFDEATSALDPHTENLVLDTLTELRKGRTAITVAHRLAAIRDCQWIYVMDQGRVVEDGTLDDLIARKGHFWHLFQSQLNTPTPS